MIPIVRRTVHLADTQEAKVRRIGEASHIRSMALWKLVLRDLYSNILCEPYPYYIYISY